MGLRNNNLTRLPDGRIVSSIGTRDPDSEPAPTPAPANKDYLKGFGLRQFSWRHKMDPEVARRVTIQ